MPKLITDFYAAHHGLSLLILAALGCLILGSLKGGPGNGSRRSSGGASRRRSASARSSSSGRKRR